MSLEKSSTPAWGGETEAKSFLEEFSIDITQQAKDGLLDPVIGRGEELGRITTILSRRKKNNPILIGESGVGKTAIIEKLAMNIVSQKVPRTLFDYRVLSIEMASIVAGTKYRGEFEERMKTMLKELKEVQNTIVFFDEIHTIVGAGSSNNALDAANILKPALSRGDFQCIGTTTFSEYSNSIEKDGALARRFQKVIVNTASAKQTLSILSNIKLKYEDYHLVTYDKDAVEACIHLSEKYITERFLPDKAIDILDEAGALVRVYNEEIPSKIIALEKKKGQLRLKKRAAVQEEDFLKAVTYRDQERLLAIEVKNEMLRWEMEGNIQRKVVGFEDVAKVVSMTTGIPIEKIGANEKIKLARLQSNLCKKVIGQDNAVEKLSKAILRNRVGINDPNRPIGSFVFLGQTGVGKTFLAKELTKILFDDEKSLIRIDMSEYMERHSVAKLIGSPPGYVGHESGGQLTEKVRRQPYSVILLDEIEKAHPDIFNILLQILDDGHITDSLGRKIDFKNTIIIVTSNIGTHKHAEFGNGVGFNIGKKENNKNMETQIIMKELKKKFSPELLNRFDEIILFNSLSEKDLQAITSLELQKVINRLKEKNITLKVPLAVKRWITQLGIQDKLGARPLKRIIQTKIENLIAEEMVENRISEGDHAQLKLSKEQELKMDKITSVK